MKPYFAYGSNLNAEDLFHSTGLRLTVISNAILPDYELVFNYRSRSRQGGAASVEPAEGHAVAGVLFELPDEETLKRIDVKEGHPFCYQRVSVTVLVSGEPVKAWTYVTKVDRKESFVHPTAAYLSVVEQGYRAHGLDPAPLRAAATALDNACLVDGVFVYGTLLLGECRADVIEVAGSRVQATTAGRLFDVADFPGFVDGEGTVHGEYVPVANLETTLARLDEIEGFRGHAKADGSLYHRVFRLVETPDGAKPAWTYRFALDTCGLEEIPGGSWRAWRKRS